MNTGMVENILIGAALINYLIGWLFAFFVGVIMMVGDMLEGNPRFTLNNRANVRCVIFIAWLMLLGLVGMLPAFIFRSKWKEIVVVEQYDERY